MHSTYGSFCVGRSVTCQRPVRDTVPVAAMAGPNQFLLVAVLGTLIGAWGIKRQSVVHEIVLAVTIGDDPWLLRRERVLLSSE